MAVEIEKDWTTESGLRAVALITIWTEGPEKKQRKANRNGYVRVPVGHALHGVAYNTPCKTLDPAMELVKEGPIGNRGVIPIFCYSPDETAKAEMVFDVHGSLTYSGDGKFFDPEDKDGHWFGFDCGHAGDAQIEPLPYFGNEGIVRSLDYVVDECESLARQIENAVALWERKEAIAKKEREYEWAIEKMQEIIDELKKENEELRDKLESRV